MELELELGLEPELGLGLELGVELELVPARAAVLALLSAAVVAALESRLQSIREWRHLASLSIFPSAAPAAVWG